MIEHRIETRRRARWYSSGGASGEVPSDAWMVIHGFGQLAGRFLADFETLASPQRLVIAPEALNRFYLGADARGTHRSARVGATWMTREDRDAEIEDYVDFLDAVRAEAVPAGVPLTVLGFSQGAATATRWVARGRDPVQRLIIWAGESAPELDPEAIAARVAEPLLLVTGTDDEYAAWMNFDEQCARLAAASIRHEAIRFAGGHRIDADTLAAIVAR